MAFHKTERKNAMRRFLARGLVVGWVRRISFLVSFCAVFLMSGNVWGLTIVTDFAGWTALGPTVLDFNTIATGTVLSNEFVAQGALFTNPSGTPDVRDVQNPAADIPGEQQIDYGVNEKIDVEFVVPGTQTPTTTDGFGLVLTETDAFNLVFYFDANDNLLGQFSGPQSISIGFIDGVPIRFLGATALKRDDIDAGNFHFTDDSVFLHLPAQVLDRYKATT